ncbi:UDP-glucuronic acid decarboxylase family protein [Streptomyces sp. NPDC048428]|uniref:UDP-glucuronic acid decarboxylase family protein n=1 Tax=Streptomyces sp. NPDC048428 TaxID=3154503 RepID=UPI00344663AB
MKRSITSQMEKEHFMNSAGDQRLCGTGGKLRKAPGERSGRLRAVVTGGAGFLGSHLCEALIAQGYAVVCIDDFCTGSPDNVAHLAGHPDFELLRADVSEGLDVTGRVDLVFHLASPASPSAYARLPLHTLDAGSLGTRNALALTRNSAARFVLASTSEVYGDPLCHPQTEDYWGNVNPVGPRSVYDEAKRFAEALTMAEGRARGADVAIARIFNTYGPRMRWDDGRAVPNFIYQALGGTALTVAGDGSQTRSLTYVDDTVAGLLALARSQIHGPVNIGNDVELSIRELAGMVIELAGSTSPISFVERPIDDPAVRRPDITRAAEQLGWKPRTDIKEGLLRTVDWFRDHQSSARIPSGAA